MFVHFQTSELCVGVSWICKPRECVMTDLNSFQSINLSQFFDSVKFRSESGWGYHLVIDFCIVMFYMLMILMKFSFVPQTFFRIFFFRIRIMIRIRISLWNSLEKVILYMLKISRKFGVAPQSFCENQNSVQNQDQDQDHDITLGFNARPTFHEWKTPTKFCLDPLTPSKVIVSTWKVHVRTYIQTDRQTDRRKFFCPVLSSKTYKSWAFVKRREFFFHSCDYNIFSFYILRMWWESKNQIRLKFKGLHRFL